MHLIKKLINMKPVYINPEITVVELDRAISLQLASDANPMGEPGGEDWAQALSLPATDPMV
jgi:hypothetical protein